MGDEEEQPPAEEEAPAEEAPAEEAEGEEEAAPEEEGEEGEGEEEAVEGEPEVTEEVVSEDPEGRTFGQACGCCCLGFVMFPIVLFLIGAHEKYVACEENVMFWLSSDMVDAKCDDLASGKGKAPVFFNCEVDTSEATPITLADFNPTMTSDLKDSLEFKDLAVIQTPEMWQCVETITTTTETKTKKAPAPRRKAKRSLLETETKTNLAPLPAPKKRRGSLLELKEKPQSTKPAKRPAPRPTPKKVKTTTTVASYKMEWHDKRSEHTSTKESDIAARKKACPGWTKNPMWPPGLHEGALLRYPSGAMAGSYALTPELMQELYPESSVGSLKESGKLANLEEHAATGNASAKDEAKDEAKDDDADAAAGDAEDKKDDDADAAADADEDADAAADADGGGGGDGGGRRRRKAQSASSFAEKKHAQLSLAAKHATQAWTGDTSSLLEIGERKKNKRRPLMRSEYGQALALEEEDETDEAEADDHFTRQLEDEDENAYVAVLNATGGAGANTVAYEEELDTGNTYFNADKTAIVTCTEPLKIGCMRIQYYLLQPKTISFMGKIDDAGGVAKADSPSSLFCEGTPRWWSQPDGFKTSAEWIKALKDAKKVGAILIRIFLLFMAWWCVYCCFAPIAYAADLIGDYLEMIPFCGECLEDLLEGVAMVIICCLSCTIGCSCGFFVLAVVWVFMRPMIGIPLLLLTFILWCVAYKAKDGTPEEERKRRRRPKAKAEEAKAEEEEEG